MSGVTTPPSVSPDVLTAGSTHRFKMAAKKNGVVWDLTAATVTLKLRKPDGSRVSRAALILSAVGGTAYFDCDTLELTLTGDYERSWRVQQGGIDITCLPISFSVIDSPE